MKLAFTIRMMIPVLKNCDRNIAWAITPTYMVTVPIPIHITRRVMKNFKIVLMTIIIAVIDNAHSFAFILSLKYYTHSESLNISYYSAFLRTYTSLLEKPLLCCD